MRGNSNPRMMPSSTPEPPSSAVWLGCLETVLDKGQREDWFASDFIIKFAVISFVSLLFLFLVPWELVQREPIIDIRLFGRRQFAAACLMMLAVGAILFSSTQSVQTNFQYTATLSGLVLMPGGLATLLLMPVVG